MKNSLNAKYNHFNSVFLKKENRELIGKNFRNFWVIFTILTVTFLAIGFANGSLEYLGKKMKDPFVNWVDVKVPYAKINKILKIRAKLNKPETSDKFNINNVTGYNRGSVQIWDEEAKGTYRMFYRTVALDDPILDNIESKENLVKGKGFNRSRDESMSQIGFIVKAELLKTLHYKPDAPFIYMSFPETDTSYRLIPIPIVGVVKNLPGMKDLISTQYFYWQRNYSFNGSIFNPHSDKKLLIYTTDDSLNVYNFRDTLEMFFIEQLNINTAITVQKNTDTYRGGYTIIVSFWPCPDNITQVDNYYTILEKSGLLKNLNEPIRLFNYESRKYRIDDVGRYENIAVNFYNLDKVRSFAKYLKDKYELQIDIAQVNAKENYNFITKLTRIISLILIAFSILSVCLFVSNLLKRHLESIKMNIGTLKAFGLSNKLLQEIYVKLVIKFVSVSIVVSFVLAWILGYTGLFRGVLYLFGDNLEKGENYFKLFDVWTAVAVFLILIISILVIVSTAKKILRKTPGDLIYNR